MSTEPKKPRARKAPAAKAPATEAATAIAPKAATAPATTPATSAGPQGLLMAGVVIILLALAAIVYLIATGRGAPAPVNNMAEAGAPASAPAMPNRGRLLPSGLRFEAIGEGHGPLIQMSDTVLLRYELRAVGRDGVIDGDINAPAPVSMSPASTVPGFAEALTLMRAGGEARFWVPPNLGYGDQGSGPIGPTDILEFHVKIDSIAPPGRGGPSAAGGNTISDEDLQNIIAAMNASEAAGGR